MEEDLSVLSTDLDQCEGCRDPRFADATRRPPGRPFRLPNARPVLFLGEAPPRPGGFWRAGNSDAVRRLLLPALPSWPEALSWDSREAVDWFVDAGFFFVQAMKWTLKHQSYMKLSTRERCLAVDHAVQAHLLREIKVIQPRAIIALGIGAWDACLLLAERYGQFDLGKAGVAASRLRHHSLHPPKEQEISVHVTYLPGRINETLARERMAAMAHDVGVFLRCIEGAGQCETAERRTLSPRASKRAAKVDKEGFDDWMRRLRTVGLWPQPPGMTFEEMAKELERRDALHRPDTQQSSAHEKERVRESAKNRVGQSRGTNAYVPAL